ncbi:MATE family efflux transporter [Roseburia sp. 499]|uniref:MATE family efflux transporter n=1 Tax=Roseburia sp. 499 TaxID=1261634 RepID=UPI00241F3518|nr:MATE family efflux transporter [Roseburia sp. 499]WVK68556.1 MATE family efflux transporter [Roseburia sp. 499]
MVNVRKRGIRRKMENELKGSMITGNPTKALIAFTLPMVGGNLFQQFYNIVDSIIVGNVVGEDALAAVGASTAITMLFVMVAIGTGIGCSVVISQLFGANQLAKMKTAISTALLSILGFSVFLSVLGMVINKGILRLMGTPDNIFAEASDYLQIYFYGFVFLFLYNAFSAIFNALGDSTKPLLFLMFSSILNIGLDLLFVAKLQMGVQGAAWATLISQAISAVLSFSFLMKKLRKIETESFKRYDIDMLKRMVTVAIPTIVQQSIVSVGMLLIQSVVNRFGSTFMAGYTAAIKIEGIAITPMVAVGNAASTYVAQNMGAKKPERIGEGYRICLTMAAGIGLLIAIFLHFAGEEVVGTFMNSSTSAEAISIGAEYLSIVSMFYFVMGLMNVSNGILRGAADMKWFLACSLCNLATRVILTYALAGVTAGKIIMWANPIGWLVGLVIAVFRYFQGGWKKRVLI